MWACVQPETLGDGGSLSARTAWLNDIGTWRVLSQRTDPLLLVPFPGVPRDEISRLSHHHVIVPVVGSGESDIELPPLDSAAVTIILKDFLGIDERVVG